MAPEDATFWIVGDNSSRGGNYRRVFAGFGAAGMGTGCDTPDPNLRLIGRRQIHNIDDDRRNIIRASSLPRCRNAEIGGFLRPAPGSQQFQPQRIQNAMHAIAANEKAVLRPQSESGVIDAHSASNPTARLKANATSPVSIVWSLVN